MTERGEKPAPARLLTRRQEIAELLGEREWSFEALRQELQISVRRLEDDLHHVARSQRASGRRLRVTPPRCEDCGFEFRRREERHFHTPGRCPRCRGEWIRPAGLRIEAGA